MHKKAGKREILPPPQNHVTSAKERQKEELEYKLSKVYSV